MGMRERQAELFDRLERTHGLTPKRLAYWAGYSDREARRWFAGSTQMPLEAINRVLCECDDREVTDALVMFVLERTKYTAINFDDLDDLDANGDGQVDDQDALISIAAGLKQLASTMEAAAKAVAYDGGIDSREADELRTMIRQAVRQCLRADHVIAQRGLMRQRRQARPVIRLKGGDA